jgi:chlorobactene glucosyltransferase
MMSMDAVSLSTTLAWFLVIGWLLFRAVTQYRAYEMLTPAAGSSQAHPSVDLVVPARNEASRIHGCTTALLGQRYPRESLAIVVVDDYSTDDTASIIEPLARVDSRLQVIRAGPLPPGWTGKSHACWEGARLGSSEWLCFIDADTVAAPDLIGSAVAFARSRDVDMLSLEPRQVLGSFWERLIIPSGLLLMSWVVDLRRINDPRSTEAAANGQFLLFRRDAYEAVGGHAAVHREIAEDKMLAGLLKGAGYRTRLLGAHDLLQVRMYTSLPDLWEGLSKNAVEVAGSAKRAVLASLGTALVAWLAVLLPSAALLHLAGAGLRGAAMLPAVLALLGSGALCAVQVGAARYFRIPLWYGLLFPLGITAVAAITLQSVLDHARGNIHWKGRRYPAA